MTECTCQRTPATGGPLSIGGGPLLRLTTTCPNADHARRAQAIAASRQEN